MPTIRYKTAVVIFVLLLLPFLFYFDVVIGMKMFYGDILSHDFPNQYYYGSSLQKGFFPLWARTLNFGHPFFAEIQTAMLYPTNFLVSRIAYEFGFRYWQLDTLFHLSVASIFYYQYTRVIGYSNSAAIYTVVAIIYGGFISSHIGHNVILHSMSWFGALLYYLRLYITKSKIRYCIYFSLCLYLSFSAGSPHAFFLQILVIITYSIILFFSNQFNQKILGIKHILKTTLSFVIIFLIPALVIIGATFPLIELAARNDWSDAMYFSFHSKWRSFLHLIYGTWFGFHPDPGNWEFYAYTGPLTIFLSLFGMMRIRNRPESALWLILFSIGLIFSHAQNPIYQFVFYNIPGFNLFRVPGRFIFLISIALPMLAGQGIDNIREIHSLKKTHIFILIVLTAILLIIPFYKNKLNLPVNVDSIRLISPDYILIVMSMILILTYSKIEKLLKYSGTISAICIILVSVFHFNRNLIDYQRPIPDEFCDSKISRCIPPNYKSSVTNNFPLLSTKLTGLGYLAQRMQRQHKFKERMYQNSSHTTSILSAGGFNFNGQDLPLAFFTNNPVIVHDPDIVLDLLHNDSQKCPLFLESSHLILKARDKKICKSVPIHFGNDPNLMNFELNHPLPEGFLYVSQTYYPGWSAFIETQEVPIFRANYLFMAIKVPAGTKKVRLKQLLYLKYPFIGEIKF